MNYTTWIVVELLDDKKKYALSLFLSQRQTQRGWADEGAGGFNRADWVGADVISVDAWRVPCRLPGFWEGSMELVSYDSHPSTY